MADELQSIVLLNASCVMSHVLPAVMRGNRYLGELGHQRAVLQSEVLLLTVQFALKHLILTQQRVDLLQQQRNIRDDVRRGRGLTVQTKNCQNLNNKRCTK